MKLIQKISVIFICIYFILSINLSKAYDISPQESVAFDASKVYEEIYYAEEKLRIPFAVCYYLNTTFPIYALAQEKYYLDGTVGYYTKINETLSDEQVRQVLLQGYPNCSFQELGCSSKEEAYIITQIAVLDIYYHYDLEKFTVTEKNSYPNIISNLTTFIQKVRNSSDKKTIPELSIDEKSLEWQEENNDMKSKTYEILSNMNFENYTVKVYSDSSENLQIVNEENEVQESFLSGEKFKIVIPSNQNVEFEIKVTAEFETRPVRKGNGPSEEWEAYVFLGEKENVETTLMQEYIKQEKINADGEITQPDSKLDEEEKVDKENENSKQVTTELNFSNKKEIIILPQTGF